MLSEKLLRESSNSSATCMASGTSLASRLAKFDLLTLVKRMLNVDIEIERDETFVCDRSLDSSRYQQATGFCPPSWQAMIEQLREDLTPYESMRPR